MKSMLDNVSQFSCGDTLYAGAFQPHTAHKHFV